MTKDNEIELSIQKRMKEILNLKDGWLDGSGKALDKTYVGLVTNKLIKIAKQTSRPNIFPTVNGKIQVEWYSSDWDIEIIFSLLGAHDNIEITDLSGEDNLDFNIDLNSIIGFNIIISTLSKYGFSLAGNSDRIKYYEQGGLDIFIREDEQLGRRECVIEIDDPGLDGTGYEHPAYYRSHDSTMNAVVKQIDEVITNSLNGVELVGKSSNLKYQQLKERIDALAKSK